MMTSNPETGFTNIYIKNFGDDLNDYTLRQLFEGFGNITSAKVMTDLWGNSKGFGFVCFDNPQSALQAVQVTNGMFLNGKTLYVGRAQKRLERQVEIARKWNKVKQDRSVESNLYVKDIDHTISDSRFWSMFAPFGNVKSAKIMREVGGRSRGFGFVSYSLAEEASLAIREMNGKFVISKPLYVGLAQKKEDRRLILELSRKKAAYEKADYERFLKEDKENSSGDGGYDLYKKIVESHQKKHGNGDKISSPEEEEIKNNRASTPINNDEDCVELTKIEQSLGPSIESVCAETAEDSREIISCPAEILDEADEKANFSAQALVLSDISEADEILEFDYVDKTMTDSEDIETAMDISNHAHENSDDAINTIRDVESKAEEGNEIKNENEIELIINCNCKSNDIERRGEIKAFDLTNDGVLEFKFDETPGDVDDESDALGEELEIVDKALEEYYAKEGIVGEFGRNDLLHYFLK